MIKYPEKRNLGEKGCILTHNPRQDSQQGSQGSKELQIASHIIPTGKNREK